MALFARDTVPAALYTVAPLTNAINIHFRSSVPDEHVCENEHESETNPNYDVILRKLQPVRKHRIRTPSWSWIEMGRTAHTFHDLLAMEEKRWSQFRRVLRQSKRELVDRVFDYARKNSDAGSMVLTLRPMEVVLMTAVIEILDELTRLDERVGMLERRVMGGASSEEARLAT